ncbi:MAG: fasciclin domain-containing protein [Paracoccaceae bacterium]
MNKFFTLITIGFLSFTGMLKADGHKPDIVDTAVAAGAFNTLVKAVTAAELVDTLKGKGPFTVFAPTDEAFSALDASLLSDLLKSENKNKLAGILTFHVLAGKVMSSDISGTIEATTVNGQKLIVKESYGKVFVNDAQVVTADIEADNGVIHVINKVLLPE